MILTIIRLLYAIISSFGKYLLYSLILNIKTMAPTKFKKLPVFINKIIDDVTVIGLSSQMLELRFKKSLDDETKMYFQQIRNRCNTISKNIYKNTNKFPSSN